MALLSTATPPALFPVGLILANSAVFAEVIEEQSTTATQSALFPADMIRGILAVCADTIMQAQSTTATALGLLRAMNVSVDWWDIISTGGGHSF